MKSVFLSIVNKPIFVVGNSTGYIIGAVIALLILVYLVYSLIKPEKF